MRSADVLLAAAARWQNNESSPLFEHIADPDWKPVIDVLDLIDDPGNCDVHYADDWASAALSEVCFNMGFEVESV